MTGWKVILGPGLRVKMFGPGEWYKVILAFGPGTHNAPSVRLPRLGKENVSDWLGMGNSGLLMLVCSNVCITGEFSIFGITFDVVFGIPLKLEVSIKGLQGGGSLYATGYC